MNNFNQGILWIIDDNEFVISLLENGILNSIQSIEIKKYTSFNHALNDLELTNLNNRPNILLLDYDFGEEGTADDFLRILDSLHIKLKTKIFLYSNIKSEMEVSHLLNHELVFGLIHKTTPLDSLVQILIKELKEDV